MEPRIATQGTQSLLLIGLGMILLRPSLTVEPVVFESVGLVFTAAGVWSVGVRLIGDLWGYLA